MENQRPSECVDCRTLYLADRVTQQQIRQIARDDGKEVAFEEFDARFRAIHKDHPITKSRKRRR